MMNNTPDPVNNLNFLRENGIQEWILGGDENFSDFITWFTTSVSANNILSDEEIVDYNEIIAENEYLSDEELKKETEIIDKKYPKIWSHTNQDVRNLERKLENLSTTEEFYEDLIIQLKYTQNVVIEELVQLEKEQLALQSNEEKTIDNCLQQVSLLQEAKLNNQKAVNELTQCYVKTQKYPLFIHQMSLEQYLKKCDIFLNSAESYMQKNFKVQSCADRDEGENNDYKEIVEELEEIKNRLYTAKYDLFLENMTTFAQGRLIDQFKAQNWLPKNQAAMRNEINELEIRNEQVYETTKESLMNKLQSQLQQIVEQQTELVIYENNKEKIERAKKRFEQMKQFMSVISDTLMNAEIVWILMQLDLERVKKRNNFDHKIDEYRYESQICIRRVDAMQSVLKTTTDEQLNALFFDQLKSIFIENNIINSQSAEVSGNQIAALVAGCDMLKRNMTNCLNDIVERKSYSKFLQYNNQLNSAERDLLNYVFDGPVNKHQYWDLNFLRNKISLKKINNELSERIVFFKEEYRQYQDKSNSDKLWRQKQILWIWFLTEPKKLLKAIKAISAEAQMQSKAALARPISGITRKQ